MLSCPLTIFGTLFLTLSAQLSLFPNEGVLCSPWNLLTPCLVLLTSFLVPTLSMYPSQILSTQVYVLSPSDSEAQVTFRLIVLLTNCLILRFRCPNFVLTNWTSPTLVCILRSLSLALCKFLWEGLLASFLDLSRST